MSRLNQLLLDGYDLHYSRLNQGAAIRQPSRNHWRQMDRTYGPYISRLPTGSRVLDLGCGAGCLLQWLSRRPGIVPVGVDTSVPQANAAQRLLPGVEVHCEDGLDFLRRHPDEFSAIFSTDVLEHVPSDDQCLEWVEAVRAALLPGGFFFCRVPNAANLLGNYSRYVDLTHRRGFTPTSLLQLLEASGLANCSVAPHRPGHPLGGLRLGLSHLLHRTLFAICGHEGTAVYTANVCAVGYRLGSDVGN
ncbi:MAG: class I SAM-dependent methyltransferase [Bryobacteraceae bacterium]